MITLQRRAHSAGYFSPDRFSGRAGKPGAHELALNPDVFTGQTDEEICQTLVHEMVHVWQEVFGKPSKGGYHNREWAEQMKAIGLQPSSTGEIGGKETGSRMMDYVIPDGPFAKAFAKLAATGWKMNLESAPRSGPKGGAAVQKTGRRSGRRRKLEGQSHLSAMRTERLGQARPRDLVHPMRDADDARGALNGPDSFCG